MANEKSDKYPVKVKMKKLSAYADDGIHVAGTGSAEFYTTPGHARELHYSGYADITENEAAANLGDIQSQPEANPVIPAKAAGKKDDK